MQRVQQRLLRRRPLAVRSRLGKAHVRDVPLIELVVQFVKLVRRALQHSCRRLDIARQRVEVALQVPVDELEKWAIRSRNRRRTSPMSGRLLGFGRRWRARR